MWGGERRRTPHLDIYLVIYLVIWRSTAALMNRANSGCGSRGCDLN